MEDDPKYELQVPLENAKEPFRIDQPYQGQAVEADPFVVKGGTIIPVAVHVFKVNPDKSEIPLGFTFPALTPGGPWALSTFVPLGRHTIVARSYGIDGTTADTLPVSFNKLGVLVPAPLIEPVGSWTEDQLPVISGTIPAGAPVVFTQVIIHPDREPEQPLCTAHVNLERRWRESANRKLTPGVHSIVATQYWAGEKISLSSNSMIFHIRPRKLQVTVKSLPDNKVKFSGGGYGGAEVVLTVVDGPGGKTLTATVGDTSQWAVEATNWEAGRYTLSAVQRVSDNAGGWIPSDHVEFDFDWVRPPPAPPTDLKHTQEYTPTFSGKGVNGATVEVTDKNGGSVAPDTKVFGLEWSMKASLLWGPTLGRQVRVRQELDGLWSTKVDLTVTIRPLAPVITSIVDNELSPDITGTCWAGAGVNLVYSDAPSTVHNPFVTNDTWTFQRTIPFAHDVTHTVTVSQTVDSQTSESASKMFTIPLPKLDITSPEPGKDEEVGRDLIVKGNNGVKCATVKIRDAQYSSILGSSLLTKDGPWSVCLDEPLAFRRYSIDATQSNSVRESERSEECTFTVVLLPPMIEVPQPGDDLPRTSIISGQGMPGARVSVWRQDNPVPVLSEIPVDESGHWEGSVVLFSVGKIVIWAMQTFEQQTSKDSPPLICNVVPNVPFMETPAPDELVQNEVVCSGFGFTGDTVTVALADALQTDLGQVQVLADRSWSMRITLDCPGGDHLLIAVQSRDGFASAPSPERLIRLGAYQPLINVPAEGRRVADPVVFGGKGLAGVGKLVDWSNPDQTLVDGIEIAETDWRATAQVKLRPGGNWVCFQQRLAGGTGLSRRAESSRFEVESPKPSSE
ncbi:MULTISPECIES: hypothetical protein [unclassified Pseudomonas]|uniref:hypothetical protein n=1 Tax=unclassified Pseudomonas TaxID=196821 RepID=UPI000CD23BD2|nr:MULTISPECIES: hypothetical protein [unclassified Pseudomonas]POA34466.1 hypothetical protein C1887_04465 [Pseudomonas sp. GW456-R21]POA70536.1 hypothetical protein C1884_04040 [Pseudomonas sp. GW460-R15]